MPAQAHSARFLGGLVVCLALATGCASQSASLPPKAADTMHTRPAADASTRHSTSTAREQAAKKFLALSQKLEKIGAEESVAPALLQQPLQEILQLDPQHAAARYNMAVLQENQNNQAAALATWQALAAEKPPFVPAQENILALSWANEARKLSSLRQVYQDIVAHDPKNLTSRLALARLYSYDGQWSQAIALCREVLARQADALEAFRILAQSYQALGNLPMAELIIARGLRTRPQDVALHNTLAQVFLAKNDLAAAVDKLKEILHWEPNRLDVRLQLASISLNYRDFGNAAQQYEFVLKQQPELEQVKINLAVCYKALGRFELAEKTYQEVLKKDANQVVAWWDLAVLYHYNLQRYDDAIATYKRFAEFAAVALKQTSAPANTSGDAAELTLQTQKVPQLIASLQQLKNDAAALSAQQALQKKHQEAQQKVCSSVAKQQPPEAAALAAVGTDQERIQAAWQLMAEAQKSIEAGQLPSGEQAVQCAFALLPTTPAANSEACAPMHVAWTQILYQLGRLDDASHSIQAALACDPKNPDALLITQQLEQLRQKKK